MFTKNFRHIPILITISQKKINRLFTWRLTCACNNSFFFLYNWGWGQTNSWRSEHDNLRWATLNVPINYISLYTRSLYLKSSGATALQGLGRQSGPRRSAKLVPTFADRGVSRGQRNGSPRPLVSVYRTWIANYFIQVAPQLTSRGSRGWVYPVPDPLPLRKSGSAGNRTRDLYICSQKLWPLDQRGGLKETWRREKKIIQSGCKQNRIIRRWTH